MLLKLTALLALALLHLDPVLSATTVQVFLTTNVTAVQPGQPFTAKCQVVGYEVMGNEPVFFDFSRKNSTSNLGLAEYHADDSSRQWHLQTDWRRHPDLAIHLHNGITYPAIEVTMVPTKESNYRYYCSFASRSEGWRYSNEVAISVNKNI